MLQRAIATTAKYLFAYNQSAARVVLDPVYELVARRMLRGELPLSPQLAAQRFDDDLYAKYRAQARRLQYYVEDFDFAQARPDLLSARARAFVHTTMLGETSGMAVGDGFLRVFRRTPELAAFFGTWFVEEINHYRGFHCYLELMGERWQRERVDEVAEVEFKTYSDDPIELAACNMFQELLAYLIYRSFARHAGDPFLASMVAQFSKDELRHFKFYEAVVARHIQREPAFRATVLKVLLKATTPYNQVSGGARQTLRHVQSGLYYVRGTEYAYFLDRVEYLLGTRLEHLFDGSLRLLASTCAACAAPTFHCTCAFVGD